MMTRNRLLPGVVGMCLVAAAAAAPARAQPDDGEPASKLKVFLLAGQSNMDGRGDGSKLTEEDKTRLKRAGETVQLAYNRRELVPLGVTTPQPWTARKFKLERTFGPELFFGLDLAEAWPDERILLIKRSKGATSLYGCWNPDWTEEKATTMGEADQPRLYQDLVEYMREVLSPYAEDEYEMCGMLWVQGETDGNETKYGPEPAETYGTSLRNLIRAIRRDTGVAELPFIMLEVGSPKVIEGMRDTAKSMKNVTCIAQSADPESPAHLPKYGPPVGHYNYAGMRRIGEQFARTFLREDSDVIENEVP